MMASRKRICIIGAGPCGLLTIQHLTKFDTTGLDIVCFEKQSTYGGQWNFTWRTGTDGFGEPCHNSMYKELLCNNPKEFMELPQYTFDEHYGRAVNSFLKREDAREYFGGLCEKFSLQRFIKFNMVVRFVKYDKEKDTFSVMVCDLLKDETYENEFSHVVVANGIYSTPHQPDIPGIETFGGLLMHSHSIRDFDIFKGRKVLAIGNGFSAVDAALMATKYGATEMCISYHSEPLSLGWPDFIQERPPVMKIDSGTVHFEDGSRMNPDAILMCTGYKCHYPFMDNALRLRTKLSFYPDNLYKGVLFTKGGNNKVFYVGMFSQFTTIPWFNLQAEWIARYIHGLIKTEPVSHSEMVQDMAVWSEKLQALTDGPSIVAFMTDYSVDVSNAMGTDSRPFEDLFNAFVNKFWKTIKKDVLTYRDASYRSVYTGTLATDRDKPWFS